MAAPPRPSQPRVKPYIYARMLGGLLMRSHKQHRRCCACCCWQLGWPMLFAACPPIGGRLALAAAPQGGVLGGDRAERPVVGAGGGRGDRQSDAEEGAARSECCRWDILPHTAWTCRLPPLCVGHALHGMPCQAVGMGSSPGLLVHPTRSRRLTLERELRGMATGQQNLCAILHLRVSEATALPSAAGPPSP